MVGALLKALYAVKRFQFLTQNKVFIYFKMLNYTRTRYAIWLADFRLRGEYGNTDPLKHLRWRALKRYLANLGINYCYKALHLSCLQGSWL